MHKTITLQSIGTFPANLASEIEAGDSLVWNFGSKSTVIRIVKESDKSIWVETEANGKRYERRFLKTRHVYIENKREQFKSAVEQIAAQSDQSNIQSSSNDHTMKIIETAIRERQNIKLSQLTGVDAEFKVEIKEHFKSQLTAKSAAKADADTLLVALSGASLAIKVGAIDANISTARQIELFPAVFRQIIERVAAAKPDANFARVVEDLFEDFDESLLVQQSEPKKKKNDNRIDGVLKAKKDEGRTADGVEFAVDYELSKQLVDISEFNEFCEAWQQLMSQARGKKIALLHRASNRAFTQFAVRTPNYQWKDAETGSSRRMFLSRVSSWEVQSKKTSKVSEQLTERLHACTTKPELNDVIEQFKLNGTHKIVRIKNQIEFDFDSAEWQRTVMFFQQDGKNDARCTIENLMTAAVVVTLV